MRAWSVEVVEEGKIQTRIVVVESNIEIHDLVDSLSSTEVDVGGSGVSHQVSDLLVVGVDLDGIVSDSVGSHVVDSVNLGVNVNSPMGVNTVESSHFHSLSGLVESSEDVGVSTNGDEVFKGGLESPGGLSGGESGGSHDVLGELLSVKILDLVLSGTEVLDSDFGGVFGVALDLSVDVSGLKAGSASAGAVFLREGVGVLALGTSGGAGTGSAVLVASTELNVDVSDSPRSEGVSSVDVVDLEGELVGSVSSDLSLSVPESVVHGGLVAVELVVGVLSPRGDFGSINIDEDLVIEDPLINEGNVGVDLEGEVRGKIAVSLLDHGLSSEDLMTSEHLEVVSSLREDMGGCVSISDDVPSQLLDGFGLGNLGVGEIVDGVDSPLGAVLRSGDTEEIGFRFHGLDESGQASASATGGSSGVLDASVLSALVGVNTLSASLGTHEGEDGDVVDSPFVVCDFSCVL